MDRPPDLAAGSNPTQQWVVVASQAVMSGKQLILSWSGGFKSVVDSEAEERQVWWGSKSVVDREVGERQVWWGSSIKYRITLGEIRMTSDLIDPMIIEWETEHLEWLDLSVHCRRTWRSRSSLSVEGSESCRRRQSSREAGLRRAANSIQTSTTVYNRCVLHIAYF